MYEPIGKIDNKTRWTRITQSGEFDDFQISGKMVVS